MTTYYEKLKDPRWQRKRLEILNRDDFSCVRCGNDGSTLHVHHTFYTRGAAPWEYPDESLITLCEDCHEGIHEERATLDRIIGSIVAHDPLWLCRLSTYAIALEGALSLRASDDDALQPYLEGPRWLRGYADFFCITTDEAAALHDSKDGLSFTSVAALKARRDGSPTQEPR